ncbi:hypothetical protein [Aeromonas media]|uniref:hypothetical protein n=1 Tax=Aeromonas media TaxID=651 RepID=UPI0038D03395
MFDLTPLAIATVAVSAFAFWRMKRASKAPVLPAPAPAQPEDAPQAEPENAPAPMQADTVHVMPMADYMPGRAVDLTALLRDLDSVFPQIPVRPTTTIEEIQFNAGQRCLADWMRQQYLARGKQVGSMSKAPTI